MTMRRAGPIVSLFQLRRTTATDLMEQTNTDPRTLTIGGAKDSRTSLRIVQHKFIIGKEEFHPFGAEMHYYRIPKRHWSVCFERIRRAEFRIISTSVPW
ncbi:MAG: hypothetical protein GF341_11165, partial [candidate division Zixibacteria bacterium]|nr:hypothetical protein [candidate division Zixibacteria bacterium]